MHPNRIKAAAAGEIKFEGAPCRVCKAVLRYVMTGRCVACEIKKARQAYRQRVADWRDFVMAHRKKGGAA